MLYVLIVTTLLVGGGSKEEKYVFENYDVCLSMENIILNMRAANIGKETTASCMLQKADGKIYYTS